MAAKLIVLKKLGKLVKESGKISIKDAARKLKEPESLVSEVSNKLSDDYTMIKKDGEVVLEYTKIVEHKAKTAESVIQIKEKQESSKKTEPGRVKITPVQYLLNLLFGANKKSSNDAASLNVEISNLLGLVKEDDKSNLKDLRKEKEMLLKILSDIKGAEKSVSAHEDKYLSKIKELQERFKLINNYRSRLKELDEKMDKLSSEINEDSRKVSKSIEELKDNASLFKDLESKFESEKKSVNDSLLKVKSEIEKEISEPDESFVLTKFVIPKIKPVEKSVVVEKKQVVTEKKPEELKRKTIKEDEMKKMSEEVIDEALEEKEVNNEEVKSEKTGFSTEIDKVLDLVKKNGKVSYPRLAKVFSEKLNTIESWCEALEDKGLVEIVYPLLGEPYIKYVERKEEWVK